MKALVSLAAGIAVLAAGTASAATRMEACQDYKQLSQSIWNLRQVGPEASVRELRTAEQQVQDSFRKFQLDAAPYAGPQVENLHQSVQQLAQTTNNIPPSASPAQAHAMIEGDLAKVQVARDQVLRQLGCNAPGAPPMQPMEPGQPPRPMP